MNLNMNEAAQARLWAFGLGLLTIVAASLAALVNPLEIAIAFMALLMVVIAVGLMTNLWIGLLASALGAFPIVFVNQYAGVYPREDIILNIATELVAFLLVGPLAGGLSEAIKRVQREADRWLAHAEEQSVHDETFGTLKPEWAKVRLDEEALRAACFGRPLSVVLLQPDPTPEAAGNRAERVAVLQAVIRLARSVTQPPAVVAHAGGDCVLLILPEQAAEQAGQLAGILRSQLEHGVYFPDGRGKSLGKPVRRWGGVRVGIASLNGQAETGEALLARAKVGLGKQ